MLKNQVEVKTLGEMLVEVATDFMDVTTTTTSNPSEADIDDEGE